MFCLRLTADLRCLTFLDMFGTWWTDRHPFVFLWHGSTRLCCYAMVVVCLSQPGCWPLLHLTLFLQASGG